MSEVLFWGSIRQEQKPGTDAQTEVRCTISLREFVQTLVKHPSASFSVSCVSACAEDLISAPMPPKAAAGAAAGAAKSATKKAVGDKALQSKSPAQFFADNKNIAGFDNVRQYDFRLTFWVMYL